MTPTEAQRKAMLRIIARHLYQSITKDEILGDEILSAVLAFAEPKPVNDPKPKSDWQEKVSVVRSAYSRAVAKPVYAQCARHVKEWEEQGLTVAQLVAAIEDMSNEGILGMPLGYHTKVLNSARNNGGKLIKLQKKIGSHISAGSGAEDASGIASKIE